MIEVPHSKFKYGSEVDDEGDYDDSDYKGDTITFIAWSRLLFFNCRAQWLN